MKRASSYSLRPCTSRSNLNNRLEDQSKKVRFLTPILLIPNQFDDAHEETSFKEGVEVLQQAGYSEAEIEQVMKQVIGPHSCRDGNLPSTIEGKVMATGDALAHLTTDFYVQFCWKHLPEGKNYNEFLDWVAEKLDRDFNKKIFFIEVKDEVRQRYESLTEVLVKK